MDIPMMRLLPLAACLAVLASWSAESVSAADLSPYGPRHRRVRPLPPPDEEERPVEKLYTRPVVGFYGYPFDYAIPRRSSRYAWRSREPYILRRDAPHAIEAE